MPDHNLHEINETPEFRAVLQAFEDPEAEFIFVSGVAGTGKKHTY